MLRAGDDNNDLCYFYATFLCAATHSDCEPKRLQPQPTTCEAKCIASPAPPDVTNARHEAPTDKLDRFLRCVTECEAPVRKPTVEETSVQPPDADHCICAHEAQCTCHFANGTVYDKHSWGSRDACESACHSS